MNKRSTATSQVQVLSPAPRSAGEAQSDPARWVLGLFFRRVDGQQGSAGTCPLSLRCPGGLQARARRVGLWIADPRTIKAVKGSFFEPWVCQRSLCCEVSLKAKELHSRRALVNER